MKRPAIFFDRDNTLIVSDGYLGEPAKVQLVPGAADAIARARAMGYATIVVSNQSGVARGLFNEGAVYAVNDRMDALLRAENAQAVIDRHEFCPFHPEGTVERYRQESPLRKPNPGMILLAAEKMALDVKRSWLVGDAPRDIAAGHAAGCRTVLFRDPALPLSPAAQEASTAAPDFVAATLQEAIDFIATHPTFPTPDPPAEAPSRPSPPAASPAAATARQTMIPTARSSTTAPASVTPLSSLPAAQKSPTDRRLEPGSSTARLEGLLEQVLLEMRRRNEQGVTDFSLSKLMAGIVQVLVLAVLFVGYLRAADVVRLQPLLLLALTLQTMVVALLIMSRQR